MSRKDYTQGSHRHPPVSLPRLWKSAPAYASTLRTVIGEDAQAAINARHAAREAPKTRKTGPSGFTDDQVREALLLAFEFGIPEAARRLGIREGSVRNWMTGISRADILRETEEKWYAKLRATA